MHFQTEFHTDPHVYNTLPGVEDAHNSLHDRLGFDTFLEAFAGLAKGSGFERDIGVFLLHRHYLLTDEQLMIESPEMVDGESALVTSAEAVDVRHRDGAGFAPSRWRLLETAGGDLVFHPLEYSRDPGVMDTFRRLQSRPAFVASFGSLLMEYSLADLLGLTIATRGQLVCQPDTGFLERPYKRNRLASVVTVRPRPEVEQPLYLPTVWMPQIVNYCQQTCTPNHWCLGQPDGSHEQEPYHDSGHRSVPDT